MTFTTTSAGDPGLGDRMRAIMWGLRGAAASKRRFFIEFSHPIPLRDAFEPNEIDWTPMTGADVKLAANLNGHYDLTQGHHSIYFGGGNFPYAHANLSWEFPESAAFNVNAASDSEDLHCMFFYLFRVSPRLKASIDEVHAQLFGGQPFVAAHLRDSIVGTEELEWQHSGDHLHNLIGAMFCMRHWSGEWHVPMMVATSHRGVRKAIHDGFFGTDVKALGIEAIHTKSPGGADRHFATFVELGMLARAMCLVRTTSGFGDVARWLGGQIGCTRHVGGEQAFVNIPPSRINSRDCYEEFMQD